MKITRKGNKAYLSITKAELAANPRLLRILKAQNIDLENGNAYSDPGAVESPPANPHPDGVPDGTPILDAGEEAHDPFMHDLEKVFKKHKRQMPPETRKHLKGLPPEDLTPDNASSGESYQDGVDPGKPYGGGFSVNRGLGFGGMGGGIGMGGLGGTL